MHIPDGFIPWTQCVIYYIILIVALYFATKWAKKNLDDKHVPLMAILAAGIFAIMSMNMPIPFGTIIFNRCTYGQRITYFNNSLFIFNACKWSMLIGIKHCYKAWDLLHDSDCIQIGRASCRERV